MGFADRMEDRAARDEAAIFDRMPRARAVNDRIRYLLAELPFPEPDGATTERRAQLTGFATTIDYYIAWGEEIDEPLYQDFMVKLCATVTKDDRG